MEVAFSFADGNYGLLRNTPFMWLDLEKFARALLTPKYNIVEIKYFTARIRSEKLAPITPHDQSVYFEALFQNPLITIVEGFYKRYRVKMPFVKEPCVGCDKVTHATVWKTEEKQSDVNLSVAITADAYENKCDAIVLISGDADHKAALSIARRKLNKTTVVFNPRQGDCVELRQLSTFCKNIPRDLPAQCQLPDEIPVGTHGRKLHRPPSWTIQPD